MSKTYFTNKIEISQKNRGGKFELSHRIMRNVSKRPQLFMFSFMRDLQPKNNNNNNKINKFKKELRGIKT